MIALHLYAEVDFIIVLFSGANKFMDDMYVMLKFRMNIYWKICWMGVCPLILSAVFIFFCIDYAPLTYEDYTIPPWAEFLGWGMVIIAILPTPGYMIYFLWFVAPGDTFMEVSKV